MDTKTGLKPQVFGPYSVDFEEVTGAKWMAYSAFAVGEDRFQASIILSAPCYEAAVTELEKIRCVFSAALRRRLHKSGFPWA